MLIFALILVFMLVVVKMQFGIRGKYVVIVMMMYVAGVMIMVVHDDGLRVFSLRVLMLMPMVMIVLMLMMTMFVAVIMMMFMVMIMPVFMAMVMVVMVSVLMMMVVIVMIVAFNALFASRATASSTHKFSPENYSISICLICMLSPLSTRRLWLWQCGHPASCADTVMA